MKWSSKVARVAGIDIFVHWTFAILLAWIFVAHILQGETVRTALEGVGFILAIFACVLLHELGHALTARKYGIGTRDITLLPIGGLARLERIPEIPIQELWIALAGPAVNVVIAVLLFLVVQVLKGLTAFTAEVAVVGGDFLVKIMYVNVALVVFNLLPAFPMDGGRVLRALLARKMDYVRATEIAASTGQGMAVLFGILGFFVNPFLIFIALFVYLGAQGEAHMAQVRTLLRGIPVREAMQTRFKSFSTRDSLDDVIAELIAGDQEDFPVMDNGEVVGVLPRSELLKALAEGKREALVGDVMVPSCASVTETEMLENSFQKMREGGCSMMPVMNHGGLVGILTLENVGEWIMIHSALRKAKPRSEIEDIFAIR